MRGKFGSADSHDLGSLHSRRRPDGAGEGAGAEMRSALGIAVFSGMLGVTFFGIFLTPVFYVSIRWLVERGDEKPPVTSNVKKEAIL